MAGSLGGIGTVAVIGVQIPPIGVHGPPPGQADGVILVLDLPAAASPADLGLGGDLCRLGLGLGSVELIGGHR